jgi:integrase
MILADEQRVFWAKQILEERTGASLPFSSLIGRYLREITPEKRSPKSDYTNSRKPLEYWADKKIDTFTVQDMYRYQEWRKAQFVQRRESKNPDSNNTKRRLISGATINRELSLVKHALRKAVRWGYISQSPIPEGEVEGMREQRRDRYITNQELRAIKEKSSSQTFRDIVDALYFTGLRAGRILTLRWNQINFDERILTFEETSRNKRVPREIPINDSLHTILCRLRDQRKYRAIISPFVFYSLNGKPYRTIKTAWNGACRRAGVMNARIHDIRHKTLSDMAKAGIPLATIKRAAGHSQVQTTDGYTHLQIDDLRIAFGVLTEK